MSCCQLSSKRIQVLHARLKKSFSLDLSEKLEVKSDHIFQVVKG